LGLSRRPGLVRGWSLRAHSGAGRTACGAGGPEAPDPPDHAIASDRRLGLARRSASPV